MRVRRLEITGFKSFADRTVLDFPDRLSAVVGPNGCGKSNVVDAVRWVLGEQSARTLRGQNMEDVLFNGSAGRKQTNMAEVSVVFENRGRVTAPQYADLTEIMVTRRLFRSGDSDYFINKIPCRLKDIHQLFMDTGLGNRNYAIIEQGRVSAFIEAKPEVRRLWLEEAAGITRYKDQKKASQKRMAETRANLDLLQVELHALEKQMERLRKQAKKAKVHKDLAARVRALDMNLASHEFARLRQALETALAEADAAQAQAFLAGQRVGSLETDLETLKTNQVAAQQETAQASSLSLQSKEDIIKAENDLTLLAQQTNDQNQHSQRLRTEREELQARLAQLSRELSQAKRTLEQSEEKLRQALTSSKEAAQALAEQQQILTDREIQAEQAKSNLTDNMLRATQIHNRLNDLEHAQADLMRKKEQLSEKQDRLEQETQAAAAAHQQADEALENLRQDLEDTEQRLSRLNSRQEENQRRLQSLRQQEQTLTRTRHSLAAEVKALESAQNSYQWAQAGVRKLLAGKDQLPAPILGLVAEHLEVKPGAEVMAESALGADLQAILVAESKDALALAQWLADKDLGRIRVVVLSELKAGLSHPLQTTPLDELVKPGPGFEPLRALWAGSGVAPDLCTAFALARDLKPGQVALNPHGERLDSPATASLGRGRMGELLQGRNELKQKADALAQSEEALLKAIEAREQAEENLALEENEKQRLRNLFSEKERIVRRQEQELYRLKEASTLLARQLEALQYDAGEIWSEAQRLEQDIERHNIQLEELESKRQNLEESLSQAQRHLSAARESLEVFRSRETEAKMDYHALEGMAGHARRESVRLSQEEKQNLSRLENIDAALNKASQAVQDYQARRAERQAALGGLYLARDRQEEAYRQAKDSFEQTLSGINQVETALKQARQELRQVESSLFELNMQKGDLTRQQESLVEQVKERCLLDLAAEYARYLPESGFDAPAGRAKLASLKVRLRRLGAVNTEAIEEFAVISGRHGELTAQKADVESSLHDLEQAINKINKTSKERFLATLEQVNEQLASVFPVLFNGGQATLSLDPQLDPLESGLHIMVELPGKKVKNLEALSGGEKAMSASAALFSLFLIRPAPFCILDEVDAPLDEANVGRFHQLINKLSEHSQILMITHKRSSMEIMDRLYGVTMEEKGVSKVLAVDMEKGGRLLDEAVQSEPALSVA